MKKSKYALLLNFIIATIVFTACKTKEKENSSNLDNSKEWKVDFLDNFDSFNSDNWQDQRIWVNNETHCYVPDNEFGTREVSEGTLKLKVVNVGEKLPCDNFDKYGKHHF